MVLGQNVIGSNIIVFNIVDCERISGIAVKFEDSGGTHSTPNTHRADAISDFASLHFV